MQVQNLACDNRVLRRTICFFKCQWNAKCPECLRARVVADQTAHTFRSECARLFLHRREMGPNCVFVLQVLLTGKMQLVSDCVLSRYL